MDPKHGFKGFKGSKGLKGGVKGGLSDAKRGLKKGVRVLKKGLRGDFGFAFGGALKAFLESYTMTWGRAPPPPNAPAGGCAPPRSKSYHAYTKCISFNS